MLDHALKYFVDLGLKDNEAQIYLTCLKKPTGLLVHEIVSETDIKRSTIDLILVRLIDKGLITRHKEGARWVFCAQSPEHLAHGLDQKLSDFKKFIPFLMSEFEDGLMPSVRFYEGNKGVDAIYQDILLECGRAAPPENRVLTISSGKDLIKILPDHHKNFIQKRIRKGISTKVLGPDNKISQTIYVENKKHLRETRFFNAQSFPFSVEINIYAQKVAFINLSETQKIGVVIHNKRISSSLNSIFQMLWLSQGS